MRFFEEMPIMITTKKHFDVFVRTALRRRSIFLHKFGSAYHHRLEGLSLKMGQAAVLAWLEERGIGYELVAHKGIYTSAEGQELHLPKAERVAKNLFLRDDKKQRYFLLAVRQDKKVDLKALRQMVSSRPLTFASEQDLLDILGLPKGWVTPLGILHDQACRVEVLVDSFFADGEIGVHPNDNRATIWLQTADLLQLIRQHGNRAVLVEL